MDPYTIHELLTSSKFKNERETILAKGRSNITGRVNSSEDNQTSSSSTTDRDGDDTDEGDEYVNGLFIGEQKVHVPEEVLEVALSYCNPKYIHVIGQVCQLWNHVLKGPCFWKLIFLRHNLESEWTLIRDHIQGHPDGWQVYLSFLKHKFLNRNLVKNHSGHDGFTSWVFMSGEPDGWTVESHADYETYGIQRLPLESPESRITYCFASNQYSCSKEQCIDLWKEGLTPPVMRACIPFCISWSELVATPREKSGIYEAKVSFLDRDFGQISPFSPYEYKYRERVPAGTQWKLISHKFIVNSKNAHEILDELRYFFVYHGAMEHGSTVGHYGPKIARSSVTIELLSSQQCEASPPPPITNA